MTFLDKKKAMLLSLLTIMILGSILALTIAYVNRNDESSTRQVSILVPFKIAKANAMITQDYLDIMGIEVKNIEAREEFALLNMSFDLTYDSPDPNILLSEYVSYIRQTYSVNNNLNISLNLTTEMIVRPYGTKIEKNDSYIRLEFDDMPEKITIRSNASISDEYLEDISSTIVPGVTEIVIEARDSEDNIVMHESDSINMAMDNLYYVEFNITTPHPKVIFNISSNILEIKVTNDIKNTVFLDLLYNNTYKSKIYLNSIPNTIIRSKIGGINTTGSLDVTSG